jgi:hypothetical protein
MNNWTREILIAIPYLAAALGILVALFWVVLQFYRWVERRAERKLRRIFEETEVPIKPGPGDVAIRFHTYHGFLFWGTMTEHRLTLPPDKARLLLKRLHRFNLTSGMLSRFFLFVPLVSLANYLIQRRRIRLQERTLERRGFVRAPAGGGWKWEDSQQFPTGLD